MKPQLPVIFSRKEDSTLTAHLETERLIIRSINESDREGLISLQSDENVMKFVGAGVTRTREKIIKIHDNLLDLWRKGDPVGGYAIYKKEDGKFMGMACLENVGKPGQAEVMAYLKPEFWGNGYGKEIGLGFIKCIVAAHDNHIPMIIDGKPLTNLVATAEPRNIGSIALQKSLGFTEGETIRVTKGDKEVERISFELDLTQFFKKVTLEKPRSFVEAAQAGKYGKMKSPSGANEL